MWKFRENGIDYIVPLDNIAYIAMRTVMPSDDSSGYCSGQVWLREGGPRDTNGEPRALFFSITPGTDPFELP